MSQVAWHYTVISKIPDILSSGELRPTAVLATRGERPALWFSTHPVWEPTATKMLMRADGQIYQPTPAELHEVAGLCRFALATYAKRLQPFQDLARQIRMPAAEVPRLIVSGLAQGARPIQWWGTMRAISLADLQLERWNGSCWKPD